MIAPIGVVSKNFIGEPNTPPKAPENKFSDAVNPTHAKANELEPILADRNEYRELCSPHEGEDCCGESKTCIDAYICTLR
jgi:hypothetical protein